MPVDALTAIRSGPLLPWWGVALLGLAIAAIAVAAMQAGLRRRWPWLLPEVAAFAALSLIHLLFFWQPYRSGAVVPKGGGDLASFFYPIHAFAAREVQDGRLPFWNPHLFSGAPHLANFQAGLLYPPNLLAYLLVDPFDYAALELLVLLHFLLASWGAYWLARVYDIPRDGAVLTGAIFAYSGFMVAHLGHYPMLATAAWAPWLLAAVVAAIRRDSWLAALLGVVPLTHAVLAGHQPILLFTLTATVAVALFELWRVARDSGFKIRDSEDVDATQDGDVSPVILSREGSPGVDDPEGSVAPDASSDQRVPVSYAERSFAAAQGDRDNVAVLRDTALPRALKLAATVLIALGLSAPAVLPMLELTGRTVRSGLEYAGASQFSVQPVALVHLLLPTVYGSNPTDYWGSFSNTEIWGYTGVLAMALAAFGLLVKPTRTRVFWAVVSIVALVFLLGPFASLHGWAYAFVPGYDRVRGAGRAFMFFDLAVALLAGWGLGALLRERRRWSPRQESTLRWGVVGLAGALAVVAVIVIPLIFTQVVSDPDLYNRPVIALNNAVMLALWLALGLGVAAAIWRRTLRGGGLVLAVFIVVLLDLFHATSPFNPTTDDVLAGYRHPEAIAFLRERYAQDGPFRIEAIAPNWQPNTAQLVGLDDIGGLVDPLALADYDALLYRVRQDRASDAYRDLNARYLIAATDQEPPAGYREALRSESGVVIWEAPDPRPRAWIEGSDVEVSVQQRDSDHLRLTLPADSPGGRLIVSQVDYNGWTVKINGETVSPSRYGEVLQSLDIPAGAHTIDLTFQPHRWTLYVVAAAISGIAWLAALIFTLARERRRGIVTP